MELVHKNVDDASEKTGVGKSHIYIIAAGQGTKLTEDFFHGTKSLDKIVKQSIID